MGRNPLGPFSASSQRQYSKSFGSGKQHELAKAFCFSLAFTAARPLALRMLSALAPFKSDANVEGQDRNFQLETALVFLSAVNVLKLKFLFDLFACRVSQTLYVHVMSTCVE